MTSVSIALGVLLTRQYAANLLAVSNLEHRLNLIHETADGLRRGSGSIELYNTLETDELLAVFANRTDVYEVATETTDISDAGLKLLATLPNLSSLSFSGEEFGGVELQGLVEFKSLKQLSLDYTPGSATLLTGLAQIQTLTSVRVVKRWEDPELDAAVRKLVELENLERLEIGNLVDDSVIEKLRHELPGCQVISIN